MRGRGGGRGGGERGLGLDKICEQNFEQNRQPK